jgi:hypothetical protein
MTINYVAIQSPNRIRVSDHIQLQLRVLLQQLCDFAQRWLRFRLHVSRRVHIGYRSFLDRRPLGNSIFRTTDPTVSRMADWQHSDGTSVVSPPKINGELFDKIRTNKDGPEFDEAETHP